MVRGQELPTAYVRAKFEGRSFIRLRNITSGKSDVYVGLLAAAARSAFNMVLFTEPVSR